MPEMTAPETATFNIVFLLFDGITQLDFTGPVQFLSRIPNAKMHVVAKSLAPIQTDCGFALLPSGTFADCPQADLLCIPGGHGVTQAIGDAETVAFVRRQASGAQWITSVCTGAFILGAAGLLAGKRATTHWAYTQLLSLYGAQYEKGRIVHDGNLITAGGVTSGIDFALEIIAKITDQTTAQSIQLALEYDPAPPFSGGHPTNTQPVVVKNLKSRIYDTSAARMQDAIIATL